jgi:hypothetical protein
MIFYTQKPTKKTNVIFNCILLGFWIIVFLLGLIGV